MTAHHIITSDRALAKCIYCGNRLREEDWKSSFHVWKHYKENKCRCGKLHHVKVDIDSSGHDSWMKSKFKSIEDTIR